MPPHNFQFRFHYRPVLASELPAPPIFRFPLLASETVPAVEETRDKNPADELRSAPNGGAWRRDGEGERERITRARDKRIESRNPKRRYVALRNRAQRGRSVALFERVFSVASFGSRGGRTRPRKRGEDEGWPRRREAEGWPRAERIPQKCANDAQTALERAFPHCVRAFKARKNALRKTSVPRAYANPLVRSNDPG